jgi:hypothetical protein
MYLPSNFIAPSCHRFKFEELSSWRALIPYYAKSSSAGTRIIKNRVQSISQSFEKEGIEKDGIEKERVEKEGGSRRVI